jgi:four helix bundle protein
MSNRGNSMNSLEDRIVAFAARCVKVCAALPVKNIGSESFADQLFRSSTGIAANYAEASEAESAKDFVHKLKVSMKELSETRIWLKLIGESGYVEKTKLADLVTESWELSRILSSSVITARRNLAKEK